MSPAHEVFERMGDLGLIGLTKPTENGGADLDYSFGAVLAEALAQMNCGASEGGELSRKLGGTLKTQEQLQLR